ncbi:hypothetical protein M8C21_009325 [Ambrosia artemisiifolia]|uniref:Cyclin-like domain-containing protein n=1 Tax=Ambrosia artemisiifolia TaxID=4212 RepID=A0AAD5CJ76_AMBAR|nr:hypothetical protein M8C21_009325 [Ambrosia artemisiifolia]
MAALMSGDPMYSGAHGNGPCKQSDNKNEENSGLWYFSRKEIEENSPSRADGIDLKKETYLRKSYCTFLQDLGMRLKVPQVTIATAIIFCHRFFVRQSHAKNDRRTIATVCMFLAGKVEETPRPLKDEVYEQQKELILLGERIVLATLAFDFNVHHPYKPLVEAIKKFKVAQHALAQVAWNFVNDGLRTSLCLQFKPHHIAAGAIFLAAKFLKVKLPSDGDKVWWQEFNVTPRQLEEVSNQMLELYEQNRVPPAQTSEVLDGSTGGAVAPKAQGHGTNDSDSHVGAATSRPTSDHLKTSQAQSNDDGSTDRNKDINSDVENNDDQNYESENGPKQQHADENQEKDGGQSLEHRSQTPKDAMKKIDKDKVRAALEKRRKERAGDVARRTDFMNDDDLIEQELEDGIELAAESEKNKQERKYSEVKDGQDFEPVEEGEVGVLDDGNTGYSLKRKGGGSPPPEKRRRN